jgi:hypothetical protein
LYGGPDENVGAPVEEEEPFNCFDDDDVREERLLPLRREPIREEDEDEDEVARRDDAVAPRELPRLRLVLRERVDIVRDKTSTARSCKRTSIFFYCFIFSNKAREHEV